MSEHHDEAREILRHIGMIADQDYRRGWQDGLEAMRAAAEKLTIRQPSAEFPMSMAEQAAGAISAADPGLSAQEALRTITGAPVRSPPPAAPTATAGRQDTDR